jgi:imidazolonepropionase-like amidohydrolase
VQEASARDSYVTAHAHTSQAVLNGLEAGLTCFEHGTFLDEGTVAKMAAAGATLVPTLTVLHMLSTDADAWGLPEQMVRRAEGFLEGMVASLKLAHAAGVRVGSGTDLLGQNQNRRGLELALKAAAIGAMEAIVSATSVNAAVLRQSEELGTISPGKLADVIAVDFDPLANPELFADAGRVVLVIQGGVVAKDARG